MPPFLPQGKLPEKNFSRIATACGSDILRICYTLKDGQQYKSKIIRLAQGMEDFIWMKILEEIDKAKSQGGIEAILDRILSTHERRTIIKRAAAMSLIKKGLPYRRIGEILWVSPSTISSIKNNKSMPSYRSRREFDKTKNNRRAVKAPVPNNFIEKLFNFPPPPRTAKRRRKYPTDI